VMKPVSCRCKDCQMAREREADLASMKHAQNSVKPVAVDAGDLREGPAELQRLDLLRRVAEVAPEEWGLHPSDIDDYNHLAGQFCLLGHDAEDAAFMVRMWDELDARGRFPSVYKAFATTYECKLVNPGKSYAGATRAEAVARAFVAVMEAAIETNTDTSTQVGEE
jgi:hypothetical protein